MTKTEANYKHMSALESDAQGKSFNYLKSIIWGVNYATKARKYLVKNRNLIALGNM